MPTIESAPLSDKGRSRSNNQDYVTLFEPKEASELQASGYLYILADGVGGASRGDRASQYAADKVLFDYYKNPGMEPAERLREAITQANQDVFSYSQRSERIRRMATTIVAAVVRENSLLVANVGDSRAYLIRNGEAVQLTRDHSIVGEMVASGTMTEEQAMASKIKNRLSRSVGGEEEVHVQIYDPVELHPGDRVLLCSDGLTRYATRQQVSELTREGSPQQVAERLIQYANDRGGADNVSVIVVAFEPTSATQQPGISSAARPPEANWDRMETMQTDPQAILRGPHAPPRRPRQGYSRGPNTKSVLLSGIAVVLLLVTAVGFGTVWGLHQVGLDPFPTKGPLLPIGAVPALSGAASSVMGPTVMPLAVTATDSVTPTVLVSVVTVKVKSANAILHNCLEFTDECSLNTSYPKDQSLTVLGKDETHDWYFVQGPEGASGWLFKGWIGLPEGGLDVPVTAPTVPPTPTPSLPTLAPSPVPPPSGAAEPQGCIVEVQPSGTVSGYLQQFGLSYNAKSSYYRCHLSADGTTCDNQTQIIPVGAIVPHEWIIMPVPDRAACTDPGRWIPLP